MTSSRPDTSSFSLRPRPDTPDAEPDRDEVSVLSLLNALLRRRRLIAYPTLLLLVYVLLQPFIARPPQKIVTAETTLEVEGGSSNGGGNAVAQALGIGPSATVGFQYAKELNSREFLLSMLNERFAFPADSAGTIKSGTLLSISGVTGRTPKLRQQKGIDWFFSLISFANAPDGTTKLYVKAPWPALAESLSYRIVDRLNERIVRRRQERVARDRRYTLEIMEAMKDSVDRAEQRLEDFISRNRGYANSPALANEAARLTRDRDVRQQLYAGQLSQYEGARIEEVRNTRMITIVDAPYVPDEEPKRSWNVPVKGLVKVAFLFFGLCVLALIIEFTLASRTRNPAEYEEFVTLRQHAFGWIRRARGRSRERGPGELTVK